MNYSTLLFLSFFMVFASFTAQASAEKVGVMVYKMDDVEIIAVRDNVSERSRDLLLGDKQLIEKLMPEIKSAGSINTYVVKTGKSLILIDTGWGAPKGQTLENLAKLGISPDKIDTIFFTHLHGDHVTGLLSEGKVVFNNARIYVAEAERDYWFNDDEMSKSADKNRFMLARQSLLAYGDKVYTFKPSEELVPGIVVIDERGHTPGHVGFLVKTKHEKLLIWGDLTHFTDVQMSSPDIAVRFDIDPEQAILSRKAILEWVARENILVAGMHILYPGVGKVHVNTDHSYVFEPLECIDKK